MKGKIPAAETLCDSAALHDRAGSFSEALAAFEAVLESYPAYHRALHARGVLLFRTGSIEAGITALQECLGLYPDYASAHHSLGNMYKSEGRLEDALESYDWALAIDESSAMGHLSRGQIYLDNDETLDRAIADFRRAIACQPDYFPAHVSYIRACIQHHKYRFALSACRKALALFPENSAFIFYLGLIMPDFGDLKGSLARLETVLDDGEYGELALGTIQFFINLLPEADQAMIFREAKRFGQRFATPHYQLQTPHIHHPDPDRRLRIGFVSGDFKFHPVARHLAPLIDAMDRSRFELYAYNIFNLEDAMTGRLKSGFCFWRDIHGKKVDECVRLIRHDRIDILIDLAGHTAFTGLMIFAERPAPVQISWLGYFNTTGLDSMDYLITDATTVHPGEEQYFTENILWLPESRFCYEPLDNLPPVAELPAKSNGYVTFGAFTKTAKLNDAVLAAWTEILSRVPDSRLILKWASYADRAIRASVCRRFEALGIDRRRLEFRKYSSHNELLTEYTRDIDIVLDTFPHSGGGTSCDALFMGVPIVTFSGATPLSRQTHGFLRLIGLEDELVGFSADEYVEKVVKLAKDQQRITYLREHLREWFLGSRLCDNSWFAQNFEAALVAVWGKWCAQQRGLLHREELSADGEELYNEADRLADLYRFRDALPYLERGLRLDKGNDKLLNLLGICWWECGELDRSEKVLRKAIRLNPANEDSCCNLGGILLQRNKARQALRVLDMAVAAGSSHGNLLVNRALALKAQSKLAKALDTMEMCLASNEHTPKMYGVRGGIYFHMGRIEAALDDTEKSVKMSRGDLRSLSEHICMLNYDGRLSQRDIHEKTVAGMAQLPAAPVRPQTHGNDRLTLGFVSEDFHNHPGGFLLLAFLAHCNRNRFRICCYSNGTVVDHVTHAIAEFSEVWRTVLYCSDSELYRVVRAEDQVDILVDMSGHTRGNRLGLFAMRPCRLQVSWPGYFNTTGLKAMDAFISDRFTTPDWMQQYFTEQIVCLPNSRFCYAPLPIMPLVTPLPCLTNGYVTFASFNNIAKYTDGVLHCWSRILAALPGSRLLLKNASLRDRETRKLIMSRLEAAGIRRKQVELRGFSEKYLMLCEYADVDIALDPFPFGGGMTSLDALYMGVPVITWAGSTPVARQTGSFLSLLNLGELIADSREEYCHIVVALAKNRERMNELRLNLREWMINSPLLDGKTFATDLEQAFVRLYRELEHE